MKRPLLCTLALGLVFAPPVFGQDITIDGTVNHTVHGNGDPADDGSAAGWPPYPDSATGNSVSVISGGTVDGDVYGGWATSNSGDATASGNSVDISGGTVSWLVFGGYAWSDSGDATASGNEVSISGGEVGSWVYGGWARSASGTGSATANGNTVTISGGKVDGDVYGGYAKSNSGAATATGNSVDIIGGKVDGDVYGGWAISNTGDATASGNSVAISGGAQVGGAVYGGWATSNSGEATASDNTVTISGSAQVGAVYGGNVYGGDAESTSGAATASNNTVTIRNGGTVSWNVYGGNAESDSGAATASDNTVTISGSAQVEGAVYGGKAESGSGDATASDNTVTIGGGTVSGSVIGGYAESDSGAATANGNTVTISNGTVILNVIGGDAESTSGAGTGDATASDNTVTISGSAQVGAVYGGDVIGGNAESDSGDATASDNTVTISNGSVGRDVYGGYATSDSGDTTASGNRVDISGGTVNRDVHGGYASSSHSGAATASGNSVDISGSAQVRGVVYGGYASSVSGDATASDNTVTISGGTVSGDVIGGKAWSVSGTRMATGNTVTIGGTANLSAAKLYGGYFGGTGIAGDIWTGNTLNVMNSGMSVAGISNFENLNFYVPSTMVANETMLTVGSAVDISNSKVGVGINGATTALHIGDTITLINAASGLTATGVNPKALGVQGIAKIYDFDLTWDANNLYATAIGEQSNVQLKALSEGRLAAMALISQGADLILGPGMYAAIQETERKESGFTPFAAVMGGTSRYDTGSDIDADSFHLMTGLATRTSAGLVAGAFFEAGWGNYDSSNSFTNLPSVQGKGDTSYYGGGILGRYAIPTGPGGFYGEGSLRAGRVDVDFRSGDILNSNSARTEYDSGSTYYGAHFGLGYLWNIDRKASLDFSTKYIWTHQNSDSVTISGDVINFESVDSHRWRTGARFSYAANAFVTPYAGAYYDHEFDGKAEATANGGRIDAPELKGGTGMGELGLTARPSLEAPLSFDLGVQGYAGTREGVSGSVRIKYEF